MHRILPYSLAFVLTAAGLSQTIVNGRRAAVLESSAARVVINLGGGSITAFQLKGRDLNPLTWASNGEATEARPMGHFLCLDRWGQPSEAEQRNGMPFHGEASRVDWTLLSNDGKRAELEAALPMAALTVRRTAKLAPDQALLTVEETITNRNKLGRIYNVVQHVTIGPPFLDESTLVDANAGRGFMQGGALPNPEEPSVVWPDALRRDGRTVNLRHLADDPNPNVVSYVIDDEIGWTTASNAGQGLLVGYVWKTADYPWFNAWRNVEHGRPAARGLEFGTTGLHQPYPVLVKKGFIFGRPLYTYIDAGESVTRRYAAFLLKIPQEYQGVDRITYQDGRIQVIERGSGRLLTIHAGPILE
ncbi:MAG: hypothetical protein ACK5AZ_12670 [Bryobacteraceae bacterium]